MWFARWLNTNLDPVVVNHPKVWPPSTVLRAVPSAIEKTAAVRAVANRTPVSLEELPAEVLKLMDYDHGITLKHFHDTVIAVRNGGGTPQKRKHALITRVPKKKDRTEYGNYGGIFIAAHAPIKGSSRSSPAA